MMITDVQLDLYAEIAIRTGVNLQPGQTLVIGPDTLPVSLECADFVRRLTKKAYEAGARHVYVNWEDPEVGRIRLQSAPEDALDEYPRWKAQWMEEMVEEGAAFLGILTPDPGKMTGIDSSLVGRATAAKAKALKNFLVKYSSFHVNYSIISIPTPSWAQALFPKLSKEDAMEKLWEMVLTIVRVNTDNPFLAWENHVAQLGKMTNALNAMQFKRLHYTAPGTDLSVDLPDYHSWISLASAKNIHSGLPFLPNIPSEEVFTAPLRTGVNGTLRSTIPLEYKGTTIENMTFTFKEGKIVNYTADQGLDALKSIIETDEGAHYLGEMAVVPVDSPLSQYNMVFLNPLYDENTSCHFAIGKAYPACVDGGLIMSEDELHAAGLNQSMMHVDFMVGSDQLNIDGETQDGEKVPVLRQGKWAVSID